MGIYYKTMIGAANVIGFHSNIFTPIVATNLLDVEIKIEGNLHLPQNITYVQGIVNTTSVWFTFQGQNVHLTGTNDISTGWIECKFSCSFHRSKRTAVINLVLLAHGQAWWDANPAKGTGLVNCVYPCICDILFLQQPVQASRPHLLTLKASYVLPSCLAKTPIEI